MESQRTPRLLAWLPATLWASFIFFLSTIKGDDLPPPPWVLANDKVVHAVLFGSFSFLVYFAMRRGHGTRPWLAALTGLILASLYGGSDEIHQLWTPHRSSDVMDWLADVAGAACVFFIPLLSSRHEPDR